MRFRLPTPWRQASGERALSQAAAHRADLLRAWHAAGSDADASALARWAALMGFVPEARDARPEGIAVGAAVEPGQLVPAEPVVEPGAAHALQASMPMLVRCDPLDDAAPSDAPAGDRPILTLAQCQPSVVGQPPEPLLVPVPRVWPALRRSVSHSVAAGTDVAGLVRALALGRVMLRLPRRSRTLWAGELHIVWDISERMTPYQPDFAALVNDLTQRRGAAGATLWEVDGAPAAVSRLWRGQGTGWREIEAADLRQPPGNATVLILSDQGVLTPHPGPRHQWLRWLTSTAKRGARIIGWAPHGKPWVDRAQASLARVHCLHAAGGLRPQAGPVETAGLDAARGQALAALRDQLLVTASFCHRLEPALLRKLRLLHPATAGEPALEAAVWAHRPVVRAGDLSRPLAPEHQLEWRQRFGGLAPALQCAALHTALSVHAWQGRSTAVADILAWDAHASDAAKGPREHALIAAARAWVVDLVDAERDRPGGLPGAKDFSADFLARNWGDTRLQQRHSNALSGLWVLAGAGRVPAGLGSADLLQQANPFNPNGPAVLGYRLALDRGRLVLTPDVVSSRPPPLWRLGPPLKSAVMEVLAECPYHRRLLALRGQPELLASLRAWPAALSLTIPGHRLRVELCRRPDWAAAWGRDAAGVWAELPVAGLTQRLRYIEPGTFQLGSPDTEPGRNYDEGPRHPVTISQGYWLADTPCTQALWLAVMDGKNPSQFKDVVDAADCPVEQVSWDDVQGFLLRLQAGLPAGCQAMLPTEAEWEYAARAGTDTAYHWGDAADADTANMDKWVGHTTPVKRYPANPWGLHDMHGNVFEWCADAGGRRYFDRPEVDPSGGAEGDARVLRGGSWDLPAGMARSAYRSQSLRGDGWRDLGFRFALRSPSPGGPDPARPAGQGAFAGRMPAWAAGGSAGPAAPGRPAAKRPGKKKSKR